MKITDFLTSPRFLGVVVIGVLQALVLFNIITSEQGEGLVLIIQGIIGSAVVVRTVDRTGDKRVVAAGVASDQVSVRSVTDVPPKD